MDNNKGFFLDKKIVIRNCNKEDHEKENKLLTLNVTFYQKVMVDFQIAQKTIVSSRWQ